MGSSEQGKPKKTKRARLGRGLSSLVDTNPIKVDAAIDAGGAGDLGVTPPSPTINTNETQTSVGGRVLELAIDEIRTNPNQPRRVFVESELQALAGSIQAHGLMQPVVVREIPGQDGYELIAGERRLRASKIAGQSTVRAIVDDADEHRSAELALVENIQRADLNPIERAMGLRQLMDRYGGTQQQIADRMGMSRSAVANHLRLLDLDEGTRTLVSDGALSLGHAKVLLSCENGELRGDLAQQAAAESWTVRELEHALHNVGSTPQSREGNDGDGAAVSSPAHPDRVGSVLRDLERTLSEHLGTRVTLKTNRQGTKGRVQIEFYDLDQFDGLLSRLGISESDR